MQKICSIYIIFLIFLCYLFFKTGINGDELIHASLVPEWTFDRLLTLGFPDNPPLYMFYNLPIYYLDFFEYYFFQKNEFYYEIMKIAVSFFCTFSFYFFAKDYMKGKSAFFLAAIFVLYPIHDATNYLLQNAQYLLITFGLIAISHALINNNRPIKGLFFGIAGSFFSYASPPFVWGLSLIFLLRKEYKKFLLFSCPQFIYMGYILIFTKILALEKVRTVDMGNAPKLLKQFLFQLLTYFDVAVGPSFWLKIFFSITQLSLLSVVIGLLIISIFHKYQPLEKWIIDRKLLLSFLTVALLSFGMYSLTGYYPQTAFNLGNRAAVYGSLFLSFLALYIMHYNRTVSTIVFAIILFSTLGISDHWKNWNEKKHTIAHRFTENTDLKNISNTETLFVSYNQFSRFGPFSHIEFFTEGHGAYLLRTTVHKEYDISPISRRFYMDGDVLRDKKYGTETRVRDSIYVYDSEADKLLKIKKELIQAYIDGLPPENRHWVQMVHNEFFKNIIIKLMPRLQYLF